jgi:hypothetical protein
MMTQRPGKIEGADRSPIHMRPGVITVHAQHARRVPNIRQRRIDRAAAVGAMISIADERRWLCRFGDRAPPPSSID